MRAAPRVACSVPRALTLAAALLASSAADAGDGDVLQSVMLDAVGDADLHLLQHHSLALRAAELPFVEERPILKGTGSTATTYPGYALNIQRGYDLLTFEVMEAQGGLIQAFKLNGENIILNRPNPGQWDGSVFWPSPQDAWPSSGEYKHWPPPVEIDPVPALSLGLATATGVYGVYSGSMNSTSVTLTSAVASSFALQVVKTFSVVPDRGAIALDYQLINTGSKEAKWAPWEITRVAIGGLTFWMAGAEDPKGALSSYVVSQAGAAWFLQDSSQNNGKLWADTSEGFLAHTDGKLLLVKCFEKIAAEAAAPGESQIEVYSNSSLMKRYVEVEAQGAFRAIAPGGSLAWHMEWYLRALPASVLAAVGESRDLTAAIGSQQLVSFASGLCRGTSD